MNEMISKELKEVIESVNYSPAVSIILPIESRISARTEVSHALKLAADEVERELHNIHKDDNGNLVAQKVRSIIKELVLDTGKQGIAIFVSPVFEKVLYLETPVEKRITVDTSFEIRGLVYASKQSHKYLVLVLSLKESRLFLGNENELDRISSWNINAYFNDIPERVANFSDPSERKEVLMDKFLHHIDTELNAVLNAQPYPLFVLGAKRIAGHFKKLSRHQKAVMHYVHGNYERLDSHKLQKLLEPYISKWKAEKTEELFHHLNEAYKKGKLATGIKDVWREVMNQKGRLLVVEKNFTHAAIRGQKKDVIRKPSIVMKSPFYMKDAVDEVIEAVLKNGGDVEFVDKDRLTDFGRIALFQF